MVYKRNEKIFAMRDKGATFDEIAKTFKLTSERVRQIISHEPNYCFNHSKYFLHVCPYCDIEKTYKEVYEKMDRKQLIEEAKKLIKLKKTRMDVLQKRIYVRVLKDKFGYSFCAMGRLLKKDHTTIMNLYYNP